MHKITLRLGVFVSLDLNVKLITSFFEDFWNEQKNDILE